METHSTQRVVEIVCFEVGPADESTALDDLGLDSLETLDLLLKIESECHVSFPIEQIAEFHTVGDIARAVDASRN